MREALNRKEMREEFDAQGFVPFLSTPEEAGKFLADEVQCFSRVIETRGITAN